ncbi:MAG: hypothetical protein K2H46_11760 [Muribaculaceae bacterium]|nr:hypothetical protein [Muribaculaceae bacterium]
MKNYFYLEPYVYYERGKKGLILVNLLDDKTLHYTDPDSLELFDRLIKSNFGTVSISKQEMNVPLIRMSVDNFMGDIVESETHPMQFQREINNVRGYNAYRRSVHYSRQNITSYISKCHILADMSHSDCKDFINLVTGGFSPNKVHSLNDTKLSFDTLIELISDIIEINPCIEVNISGIDTYTLKKIHIMFPNLKLHPILSYSTLEKDLELLVFLRESELSFSVLIDLDSVMSLKEYDLSDVTLLCKIKELVEEKKIITLSDLGVNLRIYPSLTPNNFEYITTFMSLTVEELIKLPHKYRTIKMNNLINSNFWGQIYLYPDLTFSYSLLNEKNCSWRDFKTTFEKDFLSGSFSWRMVRNFSQCRDCAFQRLCPSPSYIEINLRNNQQLDCLMDICLPSEEN